MQAKETAQMYITICVQVAMSQDSINSIAMLLCINSKI